MKNYFLRKVFHIRTDEFKKAEVLIAFFFAAGCYFTFIGSISISVFDMRFGAKYLPYILFLFPVINLVFSFFYMKVLPRISKRKLFRYFMLLALLIHLFNFSILNGMFSSKLFFAVLLLLSMLVAEKLYFISMILLQDVADVESIKRLLPLSTAVFTIASILCASFISRFAGVISVEMLFLVSGVFIFFIAYFADVILKKYRTVSRTSSAARNDGSWETFKYIRDNPFIFILILVAVVVDVTFNINDYLYNVIASGIIPEEAKFVGFVGTTETFRYILTLAVDLFLFTRVVTKLGSLNAVKIIFINAVIGAVLILAGSGHIYLIMSSKIIFTVMVMLLSYSIMQILYQPVHQKHKEKVMVIADTVVIMAGSLIGGLITLLHSYGCLSTRLINYISIAAAVCMLALWQMKQAGFIRIIERTMNLSDSLDINKLFGKMGMSGFLPYMSKKVEQGKPFEKMLMLDILRRADFGEKEKLFKNALLESDLEIRMKIIDRTFEGNIPFAVLTESCRELAADTEALQYLIYNFFMNYKHARESGVFEGLAEVKNGIDKMKLDLLQRRMFEYLYEGNKQVYELLVKQMGSSRKNSDLRILLKIMDNFVGLEDEVNHSVLLSIMLNLKDYQGILKDTASLCSVYDRDLDMMYLKEVFTGYCQAEVVEKVCSCYGAETVIYHLKESRLLIPRVYILHAATRQTQRKLDDYLDVYREVKERLKELVIEKMKIRETSHAVKVLLIEEVERLISSVSAALLEFLFSYYGVPEVSHLERHLSSADGKKMILEIVRNSLPVKVTNEILPILEENLEITERRFIYSALITGGMHQILSNLYMVLGGEIMEEHFSKEIETVSILKNTSVFKNLNMESLNELMRIGEFVCYSAGEAVVRKGETGDKLYVFIEGAAGIYQDDTQEPIAVAGCGEIFGEEDVIEWSPSLLTVRTLDKSVFFRINGDEFVSLARTNNELTFSLLVVLASKLRNDMKTD
jgi:MFS family permease